MFTGIVEAALPVEQLEQRGANLRLVIELPMALLAGVKAGDSIALNGCCLTVAELRGPAAAFDIIPETLRLTNLGQLRPGSLVNAERALAAGARMDGHFVQGHVDRTGRIAAIDERGGERRMTIEAGAAFCGQCIHKGSVCVDGVSLTVASLEDERFTVALIPHTWQVTNFHMRRVGDLVNLEADMLGKYVHRYLEQIASGRTSQDASNAPTLAKSGLGESFLREHGFA